MTLNSEVVLVQNAGNGSTVAFPITYAFWDDDDLLVERTDAAGADTTWVKGTHFTV